MVQRPTYEKLKKQIKELESKVLSIKESEEALKSCYKDFQALLTHSSDYIMIADNEGYPVTFNASYAQIIYKALGIEMKPGLKPHTLLQDKKMVDYWDQLHQRTLSGEKFTVEYAHKFDEGEIKHFEVTFTPIIENDKIKGFTEISRDITQRKQTEEAFRESEEKYRILVERANDGVAIVQDGLVKFINGRIADMFGYNVDVVNDTPFLDYVYPDERNRIREIHERRIKGEDVPEIYEMQGLHKDGRKIYVEINAGIINYRGEPAILAFVRDITMRKQIEEALRESETKYRYLSEGTFEAVAIHENGIILEANKQFYEMFNYTPEELSEKNAVLLTATPDSVYFIEEQISLGNMGPYEVVGMKKDGSEFPIEIRAKKMKYKDKTARMAAIRDLTEQKQAEEALKKSEERYRAIAENSRVGFWHTTIDGQTIYINPAMCRILEVEDPEELKGMTYDSFYDQNFFDKKNWQIIKSELAKRDSGISSTYEVELTGKKGTKRNVTISGAPIFSSKDKIHSTIGTITDITDQKKAEKALMKAHAELEQRVKERTRELEINTQNLRETNIAMKVLLKKREEDRKDIEYNVLSNVKKLIDPYFDKIRKTKLDSRQKAFLNIMESNLQEITSQFARKISIGDLNLTPTEIQIANMIRHGNSSKEIAGFMNVSKRTVDAHRRNIRKKIGLDQKRANLRSYLLSLH